MRNVLAISPYREGVDRCGVGEYWRNLKAFLPRDPISGHEGVPQEVLVSECDAILLWDWLKLIRFARSVDILHVQYPLESWGNSIVPGAIAPILLTIFARNAKIVATLHEWQRMHPLRRASILPLALTSRRLIFVSAQESVAYSQSLVGKVARWFGQKCSLIPIAANVRVHGVELDDIKRARAEKLDTFGASAFVIGCFGFLYAAKLPEKLLIAVSVLRAAACNVCLEFFGEPPKGNEAYLVSLKNMADALGISESVRFHGYQFDERKLEAQLAACDLVSQLYDDGISARRGSYWYAYTLGVPIVTTVPQREDEFSSVGMPDPKHAHGVSLIEVGSSPQELASKISGEYLGVPWRPPTRRIIPINWEDIARRHMDFYLDIK